MGIIRELLELFHAMKIIYISPSFNPLSVSVSIPGDIHIDPVWGECRRLTAKRVCLAAERAGKESDAFLALLAAITGAAEKGAYDGRAVRDWYGLVGLEMPEVKEGELEYGVCNMCGVGHWYGIIELRDICFDCWVGPLWPPG